MSDDKSDHNETQDITEHETEVLPPQQEQDKKKRLIATTSSFQGPMPPPEVLAEYTAVPLTFKAKPSD